MTNHAPKYNLTLEEAKAELQDYAAKNEAETRGGVATVGLDGMSVDEAYDVGYATAILDLETLTGPDPLVVEVRIGTINLPDTTVTEKDSNA